MTNILQFPEKQNHIEQIKYDKILFLPEHWTWGLSLITANKGNVYTFFQMLKIENGLNHWYYIYDAVAEAFLISRGFVLSEEEWDEEYGLIHEQVISSLVEEFSIYGEVMIVEKAGSDW